MRLDGAWTGVFGVARDWAAAVHCDRDSGLCWAGGYAGEGVAAANLAARTLRDLILDRDTELARLPWVGHHARGWEPEPLRWLAVQTVYGAFRDRRRDRGPHGQAVVAGGSGGGSGRALNSIIEGRVSRAARDSAMALGRPNCVELPSETEGNPTQFARRTTQASAPGRTPFPR